jgi:hypothetical protein
MTARLPLYMGPAGWPIEMPTTDSMTLAQMTLGAGPVLSATGIDMNSQPLTEVSGLTMDSAADITVSGGGELVGLPTVPDTENSATSKAYVDSVASGLDVHGSVRAATDGAGTFATSFANGQTIDTSITLVTGDRILIKDQASAIENGIYIVQASGAPVRADDLATGDQAAGSFVFVEEGTENDNNGFVCSSPGTADTVGTHDLTFAQFSGAGQITPGDGISKDGDTIAVDLATSNPGLQFTSNKLDLLVDGVTLEKGTNLHVVGVPTQFEIGDGLAVSANVSHTNLNLLTAGPTSDAQALHDHADKSETSHSHSLASLTDVSTTGTELDQALDGISGDVTVTALNALTSASNDVGATYHDHDSLYSAGAHTHATLAGAIDDVETTSAELDQALDGISANVTDLNLNSLTGGTDIGSSLHTHGLDDLTDVSTTATELDQALDGINGTVDAAALNVLTGGVASDADGEHTHDLLADASALHDQAHAIDGADHTLTGATTGYVMTALSATTFGWSSPGAASEAPKVENTLTTAATTANGDPVYASANDVVAQADADVADTTKARVIGVIRTGGGSGAQTPEVVSNGPCAGILTGATFNTPYYLQSGGGIGTSLPGAGDRVVRVGFAVNATDLWVKIDDFGQKAA